ncbi:hypothetical protein SAY86_022530 [Trapa natans]|uniref:Late embryogenesis abundant protein LEA-2 subgroup domain-containing protein n=1 Tax=Trapa natans TaxID=22666 RepID=A0AAN7R8H0_TRANT|nr:hypothetical protein SAY86_022530 [Trapa natans]
MFPRHHPETNPHFLPSEPPAATVEDAPIQVGMNPPSSASPRIKQPQRQRTGGFHLDSRNPFHARDKNPHPPPEPRDRPRRPSGATVTSLEGLDYPDHYPLHPHGKGSWDLHSPDGPAAPPPARQDKPRNNRVKWVEPEPKPAADIHAPNPSKPDQPSPVTDLEPDDSRHHYKWYYHHSNLLAPKPRKTSFWTWIFGLCCALFWIVIICAGLIILVVYLVFRPHIPQFNISSASLNAAYLDVDSLLNADIRLLVNFTNPNRKVRVDFSYVILDLYYGSVPIATQYIEPFSAMRSEFRLQNVRMISSQVRLPPSESLRLTKQMQSNGPVLFEVKGLFRARSNLGSLLRYSYPLYGHCFISLTGPPNGVLRASRCKTKR